MTDLAAQAEAARARTRALEAGFRTTTIGALLAERCAELGDAPAIDVFERGERASWAEVAQGSARMAAMLRGQGVRRGDRVAVMLSNRIDYPLLWLALARIGAVHVPVNTRYTPREVGYVVNDSGATLMVVEAALLPAVQAMEPPPATLGDARILVLDGPVPSGMGDFAALVAAAPDDVPDAEVEPGDLMNIQYTSGTTGFPKGCMLTHDYWLVLAQAAAAWDAVPPARMLTAQPFFYMDPQWHLLKAMLLGATLFMAPGLSASRFIGWVKRHRIEWCQFPILMTRQPPEADDAATALKQVATFGWDTETCRVFRARFCVTAREGFGMTEIGLGAWMPPELEAMADSASVGLDAPFRQTTIRDEHGHPVPPGARGELWVRGRGLFLGYWNRPDADAEAFRGAEDGGPRWFRTGDLFEADANGFLWLVGRLKDMIRRSSENIAAREVEAVMREMPEVEDVAAVPVPDARRGEEVKVYIQPKPGLTIAPEAVLAHARARLAAFKVPRFIAFVEGFPRTVSNKVEKRNLVAGISDLRAGSYDAEEGRWLPRAIASQTG